MFQQQQQQQRGGVGGSSPSRSSPARSPAHAGSNSRAGGRPAPPPINTQRQTPTGPTPIMRQGRFLSPTGGTPRAPEPGVLHVGTPRGSTPRGTPQGSSFGSTPRGARVPQPYQYGGYPTQQPGMYGQGGPPRRGGGGGNPPPTPTSQVRFEDGSEGVHPPDGPGSHSASFLFDVGDWSDSNDDENQGDAVGGGTGGASPVLPSEAQFTLLCLDYLRDLRRTYHHKEDLLNAEGLDADYIALAAWSLSRAFVRPDKLVHSNAKVSTAVESVGASRKVETIMYGGGGLGCVEDEPVGNDAMYRQLDDDVVILDVQRPSKNVLALSSSVKVPRMEDITDEVLLRHPDEEAFPKPPRSKDGEEDDDDDDDDEPFYEHNDGHYSNAHRFYLLNGLASDASSALVEGLTTPRGLTPRGAPANNANVASGGPLSFGEIVSAGLMGLRARTRLDADKEMVQNPLFTQFVEAASAGGFFQEKRDDHRRKSPSKSKKGEEEENLSPEEEESRSRLVYEEKYRKIVSKFRSKLASKEAQSMMPSQTPYGLSGQSPRMGSAYRIMSGNASVGSAGGESVRNAIAINDVAERQRLRRERRIERVKSERGQTIIEDRFGKMALYSPREDFLPQDAPAEPRETEQRQPKQQISPARKEAKDPPPSPAAKLPHYQEAERCNTEGNALMQKKSFREALDTYTKALTLAPAGPNSHVYYSNRSAAHLSLNDYESSIADSVKSLALKPDYAKAHSRLGLAYFAGGRYEEAIKSYEAALEIDPDNEWSRNHLEKAKAKLASEMSEKAEKEDATRKVKEDEQTTMTEDSNWPTPFDGGDGEAVEDPPLEAEVGDDDEEKLIEEEIAKKVGKANDHKDRGNVHMSNKEYEKALEQYTRAIETLPSGPNSHVYYSNRAAAYCYLAEYDAATADCQTSIGLSPEYEKAHARLGLSLFFQGDYDGAVDAYQKSLELDPSNKASLSYMQKAKARLKEQREEKRKEELETERKRREWLERQQALRERNQERGQQHSSVAVEGDAEVEGDEGGSLGDATGITSTGLTSIVTNDNYDEVEVAHYQPSPSEQEAFDPFVTTDEE